MKLILFLFLFCFSKSALSQTNFTGKDLEKILETITLEEMQILHNAVVSSFIELDEKEEFGNVEASLNFLISPRLYTFHHLFFENTVVSSDGDLCFFGGWMSLKNNKGKCPKPWKMKRNEGFNQKFGAHVYSSQYNCGGSQFRCNPLIFGSASDGNGKCIKYRPVKNLSGRCAKASSHLIDDHLENLKNDPILRKKFSVYLRQLLKKCGSSGGDTCRVLNLQLGKMLARMAQPLVDFICHSLVAPVFKPFDSLVGLGSRLNTPPSSPPRPIVNKDAAYGKSDPRLDEVFKGYGSCYGIDYRILKGISYAESSLNPNLKCDKKYAGLFQISKQFCKGGRGPYASYITEEDCLNNRCDPEVNTAVAVHHINKSFKRIQKACPDANLEEVILLSYVGHNNGPAVLKHVLKKGTCKKHQQVVGVRSFYDEKGGSFNGITADYGEKKWRYGQKIADAVKRYGAKSVRIPVNNKSCPISYGGLAKVPDR